MNVWFTADTHFGHKYICDYTGRPFPSTGEMNEIFIKNWNDNVNNNDEVYHLGDFSLCNQIKTVEILKRLNGKIHLIRGNHDSHFKSESSKNVEWVKDYHRLKVNEHRFILFHYPMLVWHHNHKGKMHLHGHSHGNCTYPHENKIMDVGVDAVAKRLNNNLQQNDYRPIHLNEVLEYMYKQSSHFYDHHK